jgi:hypothetical protein
MFIIFNNSEIRLNRAKVFGDTLPRAVDDHSADICLRYDLIVLTDEVLVFDTANHRVSRDNLASLRTKPEALVRISGSPQPLSRRDLKSHV